MKHHITYVDEGYGYESASCSCGEKWGSMGGGMLAAETALHKCDAEAAELTGLRAEVLRLKVEVDHWKGAARENAESVTEVVEALNDANLVRVELEQARLDVEKERDRLKELLEWTDGISKAALERHKELALEIGDAIEAMRVRGAEVENVNGRMTLLEIVGKVMHDLLSTRSALKDYKEGYERLTRERDEARAEAKERSEFAAAETAHANRWAERAHAAEKRCKEIGDEAELAQHERDEARAEAGMLKDECASISAEFGLPPTIRPSEGEIRRMLDGWKEARAEVERLRGELRRAQDYGAGPTWSTHREALVAVAERQREADLSFVFNWLREQVGILDPAVLADEMPTPPLVTEEKP